jgi:hypothetical protein
MLRRRMMLLSYQDHLFLLPPLILLIVVQLLVRNTNDCVVSPSFEKHTNGIGSDFLAIWDILEEELGKNGHSIVVPITPDMKSPRTGLGYDAVVPPCLHLDLLRPREVLFVVGGVQTFFLKEQPIVDCVEHIDELVIPNTPKFEYVVIDDIVADMPGCSTLVSELDPDPTSFDQPT